MKFFTLVVLCTVCVFFGSGQSFESSTHFSSGVSECKSPSLGTAVTYDDHGDFYTTGSFAGTKVFDAQVVLTSNGAKDIFVAKYTGTGDLAWAVGFGSTADDTGLDIQYLDGHIYVAGTFNGAISFDGGGTTFQNGGNADAFLVKLDNQDGSVVWTETMSGTGDEAMTSLAVIENSASRILVGVTGHIGLEGSATSYTSTFSTSTTSITSDKYRDIYFAIFEDVTTSCTLLSAECITGEKEEYGTSIAFTGTNHNSTPGDFVISGNMEIGATNPIEFQTESTSASQLVSTQCIGGSCTGYQGFLSTYSIPKSPAVPNAICLNAFCLSEKFPNFFGSYSEIESVLFSSHDGGMNIYSITGYMRKMNGIAVASEGPFFAEFHSREFSNPLIWGDVLELHGNGAGTRATSMMSLIEGASQQTNFYIAGQFSGDIDVDLDDVANFTSTMNLTNGFLWRITKPFCGTVSHLSFSPISLGTGGNTVLDIDGNSPSSSSVTLRYTGGFYDEIEWQGGGVQESLTTSVASGEHSYFTAVDELDLSTSLLNHQWARGLKTYFPIEVSNMCTYEDLGSTFFYTVLSFSETLTLGTTQLTRSHPSTQVLVKMDESYNVLWYQLYTSTDEIEITSVLCESTGTVYVGGHFKGQADLGDGVAYTSTDTDYDLFIDKFDASGNYSSVDWTNTFILGAAGEDCLKDLVLCEEDQVLFFAGHYQNTITLGSTTLTGGHQSGYLAVISSVDQSERLAKSFYLATAMTGSYSSIADLDIVQYEDFVEREAFYLSFIGAFEGEIEMSPFAFTSRNSGADKSVVTGTFRFGFETGTINFNDVELSQSIIDVTNGSIAPNDLLRVRYAGNLLYIGLDYSGDLSFAGTTISSSFSNSNVAVCSYGYDPVFFSVPRSARSFAIDGSFNSYDLLSLGSEVVLACNYEGDIYDDPLNSSIATSLEEDIGVFHFDTTLALTTRFNGLFPPVNGVQSFSSIAQNASDELILAGNFHQQVDYTSSNNELADATHTEGFLVRFDQICSPAPTTPNSLSLDVCGDIKNILSHRYKQQFSNDHFLWYPDNSSGNPTINPINKTPFSAVREKVKPGDRFWVQSIDPSGCVAANTEEIVLNDVGQYAAITTPSSTALCGSGATSALINLQHTIPSGGFNAGATLTWQRSDSWNDNFSDIPGSSLAVVPFIQNDLDVTKSGKYRLKLSDQACYLSGSRLSDPVIITNGIPLNVTISNAMSSGGAEAIECPWNDEYVDLTVGFNSAHTYSWERADIGTSAFTDMTTGFPTYNTDINEISQITENYGPGIYRCRIANANNCELVSGQITVDEHQLLKLDPGNVGLPNNTLTSTSTLYVSLTPGIFVRPKDIFGTSTSSTNFQYYLNGKLIFSGEDYYQYLQLPPAGSTNYLINLAHANGDLPRLRYYPGSYHVQAIPTCAFTTNPEYVPSEPVELTVDCAGLSSAYQPISGTYWTTSPGVKQTGKFVVTADLTIPAGVEVEFEDVDIFVQDGVEIIVEADPVSTGNGGKLIFSTTTANNGSVISNCSDLWKGITVEGSTSATARGKLEINGASGATVTIAGAEMAIYSKSGGKVDVEYANFGNNLNDIAFDDYAGIDHQSVIENSAFYARKTACATCTTRLGYQHNVQGNVLYFEEVEGVSVLNNTVNKPVTFGNSLLSVPIIALDCEDLTFEDLSVDGLWNEILYAENSDHLSFSRLNISGETTNGIKFYQCDYLDFDVGGGVGSNNTFHATAGYGMRFDGCTYIDLNNATLACDLNNSGVGIDLKNCSEVAISNSLFGGSAGLMETGLYAHTGSNNVDLEQNTFDGTANGAWFDGVSDLSINTSNHFKNASNMGLQVYSTGQNITIDHNEFSSCLYGLVVSPVENPLTAMGSTNFGITQMDLTLTCNKFYSNQYAIVGSGELAAGNIIGSATSDNGNIFANITPPLPGTTGNTASSNIVWDIIWSSDLAGSKQLEFVYIPPNPCTVTPVGGAGSYYGYLPNSNTLGSLLTLNGQPIDNTNINQHLLLTGVCATSCYASWKKAPTALPEPEPLQVAVYPNPSRNAFTVEASKGITLVEVYDLLGQRVWQQPLASLKKALITPTYLATGPYRVVIHCHHERMVQPLNILK